MSKIHVGVGEDFPLHDASVRNQYPRHCSYQRSQDACPHASEWGHGVQRHHHGVGLILGLAGVVAGVALLSLAISQPLTALGLLALLVAGISVLGRGFHANRHRGWHRDHTYHTGPAAARPDSQAPKTPEAPAQPTEQS